MGAGGPLGAMSEGDGRKRLLSLDGGGVLGLMSLMILKKLETELAARTARPEEFRLCRFFDYFGGTSTGAIIAAGLAVGLRVDELIALYEQRARDIFRRSVLFYVGWRHVYRHDTLSALLRERLGDATIAELRGAETLKSLLMIAARNARTESAWLISTNPHDPFAGPLGELPLWRVVRASTAAPFYFAPEVLKIRDRDGGGLNSFPFEDGGVTAYNNPSLALFRHAVAPQHWAGHPDTGVAPGAPWPAGEEAMLLVSIGTGESREARTTFHRGGRRAWNVAREVPQSLMAAIATENDINCRVQGRCVFGPKIDGKLGDMTRAPGVGAPAAFRYIRYNPDITSKGLTALGLGHVAPAALSIDNIRAVPELMEIGVRTAEPLDMLSHLGPFAGAPNAS